MRRREFIAGLVSTLAAPRLVDAQQASVPTIGMLGNGSPPRRGDHPAIKGLQEAGFVHGQTARIEQRWAMGDYGRLPAFADELVSLELSTKVGDGMKG
jgi:putative tryptophan/tyrosine transport system substrate-binding protein